MSDTPKEDDLFRLLVNISASSETSIERLSTSLKIFVKKYFENKDFSVPENPFEIAMNFIMRIEAVLYTVYELESEAHSESEKLELMYYKDLVLKSLVVLTNLNFFVKVLKKNNLFLDANELLEKVKTEFKIESAKLDYNFDSEEQRNSVSERSFKDVKPVQYRKARAEILEEKKKEKQQEKPNADAPGNELNFLVIPGLDKMDDAEEFRPFEALKKIIKERSKITEARLGKDGKKVMRTSGGWEISNDVLENLYKDLN